MASKVTETQMVMRSQVLEADSLFSEIQFGVELEFLAPPDNVWINSPRRKFPGYVQSLLDKDHVYHYLASALQEAGLQAAYLMETDESDCENNELRDSAPKESIVKIGCAPDMRVMNPSSLRRHCSESLPFRYWVVKMESDVGGSGVYRSWEPTELNTPILKESEANNRFPALNTALHALRNAHPDKVHIHDGCGLHVHVSPTTGLTALHIKRVATLVLLLEDNLLYHLCSPSRRRAHHKITEASPMAQPPQLSVPLSAAVNLPENLMLGSMAKTMNFLWRPMQLREVGVLICRDAKIRDSKSTAFNLKMHSDEDERRTYTLEFRHAQASFSQNFVDNWVGLVLTICKVAFLPTEMYKAAVACIWDIIATKPKPEESWVKLLRVLNDFVPQDWRYRSSELFWRGCLACQNRK